MSGDRETGTAQGEERDGAQARVDVVEVVADAVEATHEGQGGAFRDLAGPEDQGSAIAERGGAALEQEGVVVGVLLALSDQGFPLVAFPGSAEPTVKARSTVGLRASDIGSQVALLFENGRLEKPLVIGKILVPGRAQPPAGGNAVTAKLDGEVLTLSADREIVLRCGKASITLTRAGKIILRGAYVLSRSSGVNKIKGASVEIN